MLKPIESVYKSRQETIAEDAASCEFCALAFLGISVFAFDQSFVEDADGVRGKLDLVSFLDVRKFEIGEGVDRGEVAEEVVG